MLRLRSIEVERDYNGNLKGEVRFDESSVALTFKLTDADIAEIIRMVSTRLVDSAQAFAAQMLANLNSPPAKPD